MGKLADKISEYGEKQKTMPVESAIERYNKEFKRNRKKKKRRLYSKIKDLLSGKKPDED